MELNIVKRKRGRPQKVPVNNPVEMDFSEFGPFVQLRFGRKIIEDIIKFSRLKHLVEKPDNTLFGLHDYFTVIKKPLWFLEILRKLDDNEYKTLNEILSDIKLVLENCYTFWGTKHKFSKQAFRIEKLVQKELQTIPKGIREAHSIDVDEENISSADDTSYLLEDFNSKIIQNLEKKEREHPSKTELNKNKKSELQKWESEVLEMKNHHKHIVYMAELAEIGHFLALCHEVLCIKKVSQFEVERMLLMPKESTTLATIMTAFLCPSGFRGSLYFKPLMVYEVWSKFLAKKVEIWFNNYSRIGNKTQMFIRYGIETNFWEEVGEKNPLLNTDFSQLPFMKRVWILKTLCTTLFQSYKKIEEYFNSVDETVLRGPVVYEDGKFEYISLFQPEIRVYRICRSEMDIDNRGEAIAIIPVKNGFPPDIQIQDGSNSTFLKNINKKNKFYLAAYDVDSLNSLLKVCSQKKKSLSALKGLLTTCAEAESKTVEALISMKTQWENYRGRSQATVSNSLKYWIEKELSPPMSPGIEVTTYICGPAIRNEIEFSSESKKTQDFSITGKRQLKRKFFIDELELSSDSSADLSKVEEETSDWEEGNIRPKVLGKKKPRLRIGDLGDDSFMLRGGTPIGKTSTPRAGQHGLQKPFMSNNFHDFGSPQTSISTERSQIEDMDPLNMGLIDPLGESLLPSPLPNQLSAYQSFANLDDTSFLNQPLTAAPSDPSTSVEASNSDLLYSTPSFHNSYQRTSFYSTIPHYGSSSIRRPYYSRRARGSRGPRMRYFPPIQPSRRKLVRRPNIVGAEIPSYEAGEAIKDLARDKMLMISIAQEDEPPLPAPITIPPLPRLELLDNDLLLNDLQSIKLEPWLQGLD